MTIDEVIYCMKSYLPDNNVEHCTSCPYYGSVKVDKQVSVCKSDEAHRIAIEALKKLKKESNSKPTLIWPKPPKR